MKLILSLLICCNFLYASAQNSAVKGAIGPYKVELNILDVNWNEGDFTGTYHYQGKTSHLSLKGKVYGNCVYMVESYNEAETGYFYLSFEADSLKGYWVNDKKYYPTYFVFDQKSKSQLATRQVEDDHQKVNKKITGTYSNHHYFINDWWFHEDSPELEIGYNGGTAMIETLKGDTIRYMVSVVCSQTYHMGFASGLAVKIAKNKYYSLYDFSERDSCKINIEINDKSVHIHASGTMSCGFGARAYLDHSFLKTNDEVDFKSLEEAY